MYKLKKWIKKRKIILNEKKTEKNVLKFKKNIASCGSNLQLFGCPEVSFPDKLNIGNDCKINSDVYINARSNVTIGNDVTLSHGAKIISTGYELDYWMRVGERKHIDDSPIYIGNHCWVGAGAIILPGVNISGEYVVIGAGAVVTKDITESRVLVAGNPAKIVKRYNNKNQE
ncbi:MAG: acyltransferase [Clostridia bacterium]|nr:acyltransferase [Clostridia bacterium]